MNLWHRRGFLAAGLLAAAGIAWPQAAAPRTARVRGTITSITGNTMVVRTRSGENVTLAIAPDVTVTEIHPVDAAEVKAGTFIGAGAFPQPDGSQRAIAVYVFPESRRGSGEGHYPFDFAPESTMTNATVAEVSSSLEGNRVRVRYKDGEKVIVVPPGTPIVSFRPANRSLIVPGASVSLLATEIDGVATATRVSAGRNGFPVPY